MTHPNRSDRLSQLAEHWTNIPITYFSMKDPNTQDLLAAKYFYDNYTENLMI